MHDDHDRGSLRRRVAVELGAPRVDDCADGLSVRRGDRVFGVFLLRPRLSAVTLTTSITRVVTYISISGDGGLFNNWRKARVCVLPGHSQSCLRDRCDVLGPSHIASIHDLEGNGFVAKQSVPVILACIASPSSLVSEFSLHSLLFLLLFLSLCVHWWYCIYGAGQRYLH